LRLELRYPATSANAEDHAQLAAEISRSEFDVELNFMPNSLETLDGEIESLREEGLSAEDAAEALFVMGCYLGEVMVRALDARWIDTARSPLAGLSAWPMVVVVRGGTAWDAIGKVFKRFEIGDTEYLPAFYVMAAQSAGTIG
jgi:hypothetical protein